jgi:hypothetical protein
VDVEVAAGVAAVTAAEPASSCQVPEHPPRRTLAATTVAARSGTTCVSLMARAARPRTAGLQSPARPREASWRWPGWT